MEEIKVHVIKYPDRSNLVLRYLCPLTGKQVSKSAGTANARAAEKAAGAWEKELQSGTYQKPSKMTWEAFCDYWRTHFLPSVARNSAETYEATISKFGSLCNPQKLADVTTTRVTGFVTQLRSNGLTEATVARHTCDI